MSEALITEKTREYLFELRLKHRPHVYYHKVSDKFTSGLPDWYILIKGVSLHIEQKDRGKEPRKLQVHTIRRIREAGGKVLVTDSFHETVKFIESVLRATHLLK